MYRMLIADDEMIERAVLYKMLSKNLEGQCEIYQAENGRQALELYEKEKIQIQKEQGEDELLKENTIDFTAFSYYFSQVSTTKQGWEKTSGNLIMANKNPYLETSEWVVVTDSIFITGQTLGH